MSKPYLLTVGLCILLCVPEIYAQKTITKVLTLDEMFRLAAENSKQLKLSKSEIEKAGRASDRIKNLCLPSIDASLSFSYLGDGMILDRDFSNRHKAPMPHFGNNFSIEASQVIFSGGTISNNIAKAGLREKIAQLDYEKNQMDIRFLLIGYYLDLYKLNNQKEVYYKNIEQTNLLIKQIKARQQEGMALKNDITRHELTLQNYELALIEINNDRNILNHHLITVLGLPDNTIIQPDTTILNIPLPDFLQDDLVVIAENNLPVLKSSGINLELAKKEINIAKADYFPSVALVAANYFNGPITIEVPAIDKNFNYWYAGVGIKYNLASLFKSKKNVRLAKAQYLIALDTKNVVSEQTEITIHDNLIRYNESFEKLNVFAKNLELAGENYRIINNRYVNDLVLITEMLDAANTKLNAELQIVNAKINIIYNYYKLQHSIGKL